MLRAGPAIINTCFWGQRMGEGRLVPLFGKRKEVSLIFTSQQREKKYYMKFIGGWMSFSGMIFAQILDYLHNITMKWSPMLYHYYSLSYLCVGEELGLGGGGQV